MSPAQHDHPAVVLPLDESIASADLEHSSISQQTEPYDSGPAVAKPTPAQISIGPSHGPATSSSTPFVDPTIHHPFNEDGSLNESTQFDSIVDDDDKDNDDNRPWYDEAPPKQNPFSADLDGVFRDIGAFKSIGQTYFANYELSSDHFHHAIEQAGYLSQCGNRESEGSLPWTRAEAHFVIPGSFNTSRGFFYDLHEDRCFSVSTDEILTPDDVAAHWPAVEQADYDEVASFAKHEVFEIDLRSNATNVVDGVWVRKWKDRSKGLVKSRCCGRGYLDKQKTVVDRHSSTASRLSHRIAVSIATQFDLTMECFDISTAFLQGLRFSEVAARSRELGHEARVPRAVWFKPPANVWRHLRDCPTSSIRVEDFDVPLFALKCLKALYGLVDGPLMWQIALLSFLKHDLGFQVSYYDDHFLFRTAGHTVTSICTVHIDDLFLAASQQGLDHFARRIAHKFGTPKRHAMPFTYLGVVHERLSPYHVLLHQVPYLQKLKPAVCSDAASRQPDTAALFPAEHKEFRSLLCSLLWVCQTRADIAHDVVSLQSEMVSPRMEHFKVLNLLLRKAIANAPQNGLHFARLAWPIRIVSIADSGHATKKSCYPYEGKFVFIMSDQVPKTADEWLSSAYKHVLEGHAHPMYFSARKATRISHSTSHAETLSAVGCTQTAQLVSLRFTEVFAQTLLGRPLSSPRDLLELQHRNVSVLPLDHVTDCMDFFELVTNMKGLSSDKSQRVAILAVREDRMTGRIRFIMHWPTKAMVADGLTKLGAFPQLMHLLTTGYLHLPLDDSQFIRIRYRMASGAFTEKDLEDLDW